MKPVETNGSDVEPAWDEFGIDRRDFRPHWNGDLVNVFSVVDRQESEAETERLMKECARSLARWVIDHRDQFSPEDRFQLIVAWPKTIREFARQTIKIGGTFDELRQIADGDLPFEMRRDWSTGLFSESPREPVTGRQGGASDGDTPSH